MAARRVFARDGFEPARIEDIASDAGKTRGAFYANFKNKEDVFFAIFEQDLATDQAHLAEALKSSADQQQGLDALLRYLLAVTRDRARVLLNLEFKLYAIRRPRHWKRLSELHAAMCMRCAETHVDELFASVPPPLNTESRSRAALLGAVLDGVGLNLLFFEASAIQEDQVRALIRAGLEIALSTH